jgi:hypothetical protein
MVKAVNDRPTLEARVKELEEANSWQADSIARLETDDDNASTVELRTSLVAASDAISGWRERAEKAEARVAELERQQSRLAVLLFTTEQASPEDLPPCGVDNETLASQHHDAVLKISDRLAEHFGDENEHLGQPYGNVYDAIYDALGRLVDRVAELESELDARRRSPVPQAQMEENDELRGELAGSRARVVELEKHITRICEHHGVCADTDSGYCDDPSCGYCGAVRYLSGDKLNDQSGEGGGV